MQAALPTKLRGALTRGEQKAIQVLSWDDPNPLLAERDFHQRMIDMEIGDPKAHKRQLADLKLAEAALKNPSKRLVKALELTQRVVADMERIKIEDLGLLPETAEGRVAKAGQALRGEDVVGGEKVNPDSFYLPTQPRGKVKRPPSARAGFYSPKAGPFGMPPGRDMPELTHTFTGKAIQAGDIRIDATSLATEAYGRTVRAATVKERARETVGRRLADSLRPSRGRDQGRERDPGQAPCRGREARRGRLRPEGRGASAERHALADRSPLPRPEETDRGRDSPCALDRRPRARRGKQEPSRPRACRNRGAGRQRTASLHDALPAPRLHPEQARQPCDGPVRPGLAVAGELRQGDDAERRYGAENTRTIRDLVGAGKSQSYVTSSSGKFSHAVATFWNNVADRDERVAAFVYYMERKGYKTQEDATRLLNDPAARADLVEVKRRANKSLVEFDNLLPIEKNYIRHFVFVYPWVSRSAVWSIRAVLEHPVKTDVLAHLGEFDQGHDPLFAHAPLWFKRTGYIPIGFNPTAHRRSSTRPP
jgi:hypothetical protein